MVPLLTRVMWKVSPMRPRRMGPGELPLNVQWARVRVSVTSMVPSVAVNV